MHRIQVVIMVMDMSVSTQPSRSVEPNAAEEMPPATLTYLGGMCRPAGVS
jgi:hypothetical protein